MKKRISSFILAILVGCAFSGKAHAFYIPFEGSIDFSTQSAQTVFQLEKEGRITLEAKRQAAGRYNLKANIEGMKTKTFDVSTQLESNIEIRKDRVSKELVILGNVHSQYSLLNFQSTPEIAGQFMYHHRRLSLQGSLFSRVIVNGYLELAHPYTVDVTLKLDHIAMNDFLDFFMKERAFDATGLVSGEIKLTNNLNELHVRSTLASDEGQIKDLAFTRFLLSTKGIYPKLEVVDSTVYQSDGISFHLAGNIDLSDREGFKKQLKLLDQTPLINDSLNNREWTIKRSESKGTSATELKSLLRGEKQEGSQEASDMLGIKKSLEF